MSQNSQNQISVFHPYFSLGSNGLHPETPLLLHCQTCPFPPLPPFALPFLTSVGPINTERQCYVVT